MSEKLGDAILELKTDSKKFDTGIKKAEKRTKGLEKNLKKTGLAAVALKTKLAAVGIGLVAFGIAFKKAFDFAEAGAKIMALRRSFDNLARTYGASGKQILKELKAVSRGTVTTTNLIASANKALLLGIDPAKFVKLMEIARAASKATGDTITKSFEDITTGIGRQSRMILDNLGIIVKMEEANEKYAATLGIEASQLTDVQKKQAFLNATLAAGEKIIKGVGEDIEDTADKLAQFKTAISETIDALKILTITALGGAIIKFQELSSAIKSNTAATFDFNKALKEQAKISKEIAALTRFRGGAGFPFIGGPKGIAEELNQLRTFRTMTKDVEKTEDALVDLDKEINVKGEDLGNMATAGEIAFDRMKNAVTGWASSFSGTLTDILFGAEATFSNILDSFLRMLTQMIIQTRIIEPLLGSLFGGFGGPSPSFVGPPAPKTGLLGLGGAFGIFDKGGIVPGRVGAPMPAIVHGGEEVLTPGQRGGGNVTVNVIGAPEGTRTEESRESGGGRRIDVIIDEEMANNTRQGTKFHNALTKTFNNMSGTLIGR